MSTRRLLWLVGIAGVALGIGVAVVLATHHYGDQQGGDIAATLLIGWSFLGTGLYAWASRPHNRIGGLMVAVGMTWTVVMLSNTDVPLLFTIGALFSAVPYAFVVHLLLAYPSGLLRTAIARRVVAALYVVVAAGSLLYQMFDGNIADQPDSPANLLLIADRPGLADAILLVVTIIGLALVGVAGVLIARRWRAAPRLQRRGLAPVLWTGSLFLATLALTLVADQLTDSDRLEDAFGGFALLFFLAVPYAYLAGLLGLGWSRGQAMGALVGGLNAAEERQSVRDAIAETLDDPSVVVVFKRPEREEWVDAQGQRVELPDGREVTAIHRDSEVVGAIVHRPSLSDDPELLQAVADAAALALENERLEAELRARVKELQESRANIIAFGLAERRRLERDLHDGAQQRLVALSLQVNLARAKLEDDPATAATLLDSARDELRQALDELRELARGIHPAILTDQGLGPAVDALAQRSPVPVEVDGLEDATPLPAQVEAVAYFVVSEALTNVAKYASASHASVRVRRLNGHAVVEVRDDGVGGADASRGTGLRGLADRVAALDGQLRIDSPTGGGTVVRAYIPCASS
jgi:signal transduction histidine kinase